MKKEELRIGNLVYGSYDDDGQELLHACKIVAIDETQSLGDDGGWSYLVESLGKEDIEYYYSFDPIPLTDVWLDLLGFFKHNNAWVLKFPCSPRINFEFGIFEYPDGTLKYNSAEYDPEIKSVHQLQNLYFALTGEELKLDEKAISKNNPEYEN